MSGARAVLGLVVLGLFAWLVVAVLSEPAEPAGPATWESSRQCAECHPRVFAEWESSQHAISWTNPAVRALSNDFANTDCIDCHAPRPVFETGIGERVLPRVVRRSEGVDCIACHQVTDERGRVRMAGTIDDLEVACRPIAMRALGTPEFCAGCHDQHETVRQWRASSWPDRGEDCLTCHMPERPDGSGRDHRALGGNDLAMLERAVDLRGRREGGRWVVEVENVGAGHAFPTDERSRAADVFWRPLAPEGSEPGPWRHLHRFRSPYRFETDLPDTLLPADATWEGELPAGAPDAVEVALFYKRSPHWADPEAPDPEREATLVERVELGR